VYFFYGTFLTGIRWDTGQDSYQKPGIKRRMVKFGRLAVNNSKVQLTVQSFSTPEHRAN
jgi:hypothetical protein